MRLFRKVKVSKPGLCSLVLAGLYASKGNFVNPSSKGRNWCFHLGTFCLCVCRHCTHVWMWSRESHHSPPFIFESLDEHEAHALAKQTGWWAQGPTYLCCPSARVTDTPHQPHMCDLCLLSHYPWNCRHTPPQLAFFKMGVGVLIFVTPMLTDWVVSEAPSMSCLNHDFFLWC